MILFKFIIYLVIVYYFSYKVVNSILNILMRSISNVLLSAILSAYFFGFIWAFLVFLSQRYSAENGFSYWIIALIMFIIPCVVWSNYEKSLTTLDKLIEELSRQLEEITMNEKYAKLDEAKIRRKIEISSAYKLAVAEYREIDWKIIGLRWSLSLYLLFAIVPNTVIIYGGIIEIITNY